MTGLTISSYMPPDILFTVNGTNDPLLEFRRNSENLKRVENGEEILSKIDNEELTNELPRH